MKTNLILFVNLVLRNKVVCGSWQFVKYGLLVCSRSVIGHQEGGDINPDLYFAIMTLFEVMAAI